MFKKIFLVIVATVTVITAALSLFLNVILGAFGLVATSVDQMQNLLASQRVVEKMKYRNAQKKKNINRKFTKKATKKISASAVAAATAGTVAVVGVTSYFLVDDYCEDQQDLLDEKNLLDGTNDPFTWQQCVQEGTQDVKETVTDLKNSSSEAVSEAMKKSGDYGSEKWAEINEAVSSALTSTKDGASDLWNGFQSWFDD